MRRILPGAWLGVFLLLPIVSIGCQHNPPVCARCAAAASASARGTPVGLPSSAASAVAYAPRSVEPSPPLEKPAAAKVHRTAKPILTAAPNGAPFAIDSTSEPLSDKANPVEATTMDSPPRFGHDPNYRWLVGTLDYSKIQRGWLLRYGPLQEEDRYGGCVLLLAPSHDTTFKSGQTVRVEGSLIDPTSHQLRPAYRVENVRVEQP